MHHTCVYGLHTKCGTCGYRHFRATTDAAACAAATAARAAIAARAGNFVCADCRLSKFVAACGVPVSLPMPARILHPGDEFTLQPHIFKLVTTMPARCAARGAPAWGWWGRVAAPMLRWRVASRGAYLMP